LQRGPESRIVDLVAVTKRDVAMLAIGAVAAVATGIAVRRVGAGPAAARVGPAAGDGDEGAAGGPAPSARAAADAGAAPGEAAAVERLRQRIAAVEKNRAALQRELERAQERLARLADGGRRKSEFDLTPEDWAQLARDGTVKYRLPCEREQNFVPGAEDLPELGLTPEEVPLLADAYRRSLQRSWGEVKALCTQALGSAEVAEKLGRNTCTHLILDLARRGDSEAVDEGMRQVAEIRAGQRPPPPPEEQSPVVQLFLSLTGELKRFEDDLARDLGPEAAHQIAFSSHLCANQSTFGGPGPRRPAAPPSP
jgi:hypothetical protein